MNFPLPSKRLKISLWETLNATFGITEMNELLDKSQDEIRVVLDSLSLFNLRDLNIELWKLDEVIMDEMTSSMGSVREQLMGNKMSKEVIRRGLTKEWLKSIIEDKLDEIQKNESQFKFEGEENKLDNPPHENRQEFFDEGF